MIETVIEFVKANAEGSQAIARTGDFFGMIMIVISLVACAVIAGIFLVKKPSFESNNFSFGNLTLIKNNQKKIITSIFVAVLLAVAILMLFVNTSIANAANENSKNIQVPNKITAYVNDDGSINVNNADIVNNNSVSMFFSQFGIKANGNNIQSLN